MLGRLFVLFNHSRNILWACNKNSIIGMLTSAFLNAFLFFSFVHLLHLLQKQFPLQPPHIVGRPFKTPPAPFDISSGNDGRFVHVVGEFKSMTWHWFVLDLPPAAPVATSKTCSEIQICIEHLLFYNSICKNQMCYN